MQNKSSLTQVDNVVRWDWVVMFASIMEGLEIYLCHILIVEIHERTFKELTILPFSSLILKQCMDDIIPIWHFDKLLDSIKTLDIGLIRYDNIIIALRKELHVEVAHLGDDLSADVD